MTKLYLSIVTIILLFNTTISAQNDIFKIVEKMPVYGDCNEITEKAEKKACSEKSIYEFVGQQIVYPDSAYMKGTEGTVVVRFVVDKTGEVKDAEVVRDIGNGCGEEALRVVGLMDQWKPGLNKGEPVNVQMHLPVKFKINRVPITIKTEKFEQLRDIFCTNYLVDFIKIDVLKGMADDELTQGNLCDIVGVENRIGKMKLTHLRNDVPISKIESLDGTFTPAMRQVLKTVEVDDVVEFEYEMLIELDEENNISKDMYKSVIVE